MFFETQCRFRKRCVQPRVTNCPGMPGTVPESRVCVPRPGQKQSRTIKCSGIGSSTVTSYLVPFPSYRSNFGHFAFLSPPLGSLGTTYDVHLGLIVKRVVDFPLVFIKLFSLGVTTEALWAK